VQVKDVSTKITSHFLLLTLKALFYTNLKKYKRTEIFVKNYLFVDCASYLRELSSFLNCRLSAFPSIRPPAPDKMAAVAAESHKLVVTARFPSAASSDY
jgi:hypothetical protein